MKHFWQLTKLLLLFSAFSTLYPNEAPKAKWTVMIYAEADSILNNFAARNFHAMSNIGSNENLNIIVQWNQPHKKGTWRYKIDKHKMTLIHNHSKTRTNFSQDLIDFVSFAAEKYPADEYALILWNHGLGILDPDWGNIHQFAINPSMMSARSQIEGITCPLRGILFDISNKNYLDNQGLINALSHLTTNVTKKKFAIIGMDACLMSMLEVCYQIKNFAHYSVASEEVELAQGWDYKFLEDLAITPVCAEKLAKTIVSMFKDFYQGKTKFYTQSAIYLEGIEALKQNLDAVVSNIILHRQSKPKKINLAIKKARKACFQLSIPCYVDLYSFYSELDKHLTPDFKILKTNLKEGMAIIDKVVIANVTSNHLSRAKGISIYYPSNNIDPSYFNTLFVQDSLWLPFLQQSLR
jgi:hypothetical protein